MVVVIMVSIGKCDVVVERAMMSVLAASSNPSESILSASGLYSVWDSAI